MAWSIREAIEFCMSLGKNEERYHCPGCQMVYNRVELLQSHLTTCNESNDWRNVEETHSQPNSAKNHNPNRNQ